MINSEDYDGCAGIDMPGPANGPPQGRGLSAGPLSLQDVRDDRNALLCVLIYAARNLAASQITIATGIDRTVICAACGRETPAGIPLQHKPTCLAAEVTAIIEQLVWSKSLDLNLKRREDAEERNSASAGDGNRSRIAFREPWKVARGPEPGTFCVIDRDELVRADISGRFVDRLAIAERIAACINYCSGDSTELLTKLKAAADGGV